MLIALRLSQLAGRQKKKKKKTKLGKQFKHALQAGKTKPSPSAAPI